MAVTVSMRWEGGRELEQALAERSTRVSKNLLTRSLHEAAEPMRSEMGILARRGPTDPHLYQHIVTMTMRRGEYDFGTLAGPAVAVGPLKKGFFYGGFLEFGTTRMRPFPFARPAFDHAAESALRILREALWRKIGSSRGKGPTMPTMTTPTTTTPTITAGPGGSTL